MSDTCNDKSCEADEVKLAEDITVDDSSNTITFAPYSLQASKTLNLNGHTLDLKKHQIDLNISSSDQTLTIDGKGGRSRVTKMLLSRGIAILLLRLINGIKILNSRFSISI